MKVRDMLRSNTVRGATLAFLGVLASPELLDALPEKWSTGLKAFGTLLAVIGARDALQKFGSGGSR